ncbi:MAG: hypothetical protein LBQ54_12980 [Planctomycetaceae bacterium]|nr:hypothetical protein [Planctomycetaceae bacterium]
MPTVSGSSYSAGCINCNTSAKSIPMRVSPNTRGTTKNSAPARFNGTVAGPSSSTCGGAGNDYKKPVSKASVRTGVSKTYGGSNSSSCSTTSSGTASKTESSRTPYTKSYTGYTSTSKVSYYG